MKNLSDDEIADGLELAANDIDVDASAKADARASMLSVYETAATRGADAAQGSVTDVVGQIELVRLTTDGRSGTRWRVALAAAALVVVAVGVGLGIGQTSRFQVTTPPSVSTSTMPPPSVIDVVTVPSSTASTTVAEGDTDGASDIAGAEAVGRRFMQARADYDGETLVAMLAPNTRFGGSELAQSVDEYVLQSEWERILGWQFQDSACSASTSQRVVCTYSVQDAFNEAVGKGPFPGNSFLLEIDGEQIVSVTHNLTENDEFFAETEVQFFSWVRNNYPNDLERMLDGDRLMGGAFRTFVRLSAESIRLWDDHVSEYLATAGSAG